ncbi:hypothetical protein SAMN04244571_02243, partial [Azotobacter beijerinckii]
ENRTTSSLQALQPGIQLGALPVKLIDTAPQLTNLSDKPAVVLENIGNRIEVV